MAALDPAQSPLTPTAAPPPVAAVPGAPGAAAAPAAAYDPYGMNKQVKPANDVTDIQARLRASVAADPDQPDEGADPKQGAEPNKPAVGSTDPNVPPSTSEAVTVSEEKDDKNAFSREDLQSRYQEMEDRVNEDEVKKADVMAGKGMPPPQKEPPKPEPKFTNPAEAWGSFAMLAAGIGSLMTRAPLTTALGAGAAVIEAFHANDMQAAKEQMDIWKVSMENYQKQSQYEIQTKKDIIATYDKDEQLAIAKYRAYTTSWGDDTGRTAAEARTLHALQNEVLMQQKLQQSLLLNQAKLQQAMDIEALGRSPSVKEAVAKARNPDEAHAIMAAIRGGMLPDDLMYNAQRLYAGDESVLTGLSRSGPGLSVRLAIQTEARIMDQVNGGDGAGLAARIAAYKGVVAGFRTLGTTTARISLGANEVKVLRPQVLAASEQLKRTQFKTLNAIIQAGQREHGNTELRSLATRMTAFKSAFSQVLTRGGMTTDSAREQADHLFDTTDPKNTLEAALNAVDDEVAAVRGAPLLSAGDLAEQIGAKPGSVGAQPGTGEAKPKDEKKADPNKHAKGKNPAWAGPAKAVDHAYSVTTGHEIYQMKKGDANSWVDHEGWPL